MSTLTNFPLNKSVADFDLSPIFDSYSRVTIVVDDETEYTTGTDTGRTLTIENPFGTQEMAENILASLAGYQYQPYAANSALLDPAAEIGDAATINAVMGGIYEIRQKFTRLAESDISAPYDEEIDHEYPYNPPADRKIARQAAQTRSEFAVQSGLIAAKVSQVGGDSQSFGWELLSDSFTLTANGRDVFMCDENGIVVDGEIRARSGVIGVGPNAFTISDKAIYNGVTGVGDTEHYGVYLGTDGIQLGKGAFSVDSMGNLVASSATLSGEVHAQSGTIGSGESVFLIDGAAIKNGMTSLMDTSHNGVYVGVDGFALGGGKFRVNANGELTATSGKFTGETYASSIRSSGSHGYGGSFNGAGLSDDSVSYGKTGFKSTLNQVGTNKSDIAAINKLFTATLTCNNLTASMAGITYASIKSSMTFQGYGCVWRSATDGSGNTIRYLGR